MKSTTFQAIIHGSCATAICVVAVCVYAFVFRPMAAETAELQTSIASRVEFLAGSEEINARNRELHDSLTKTEELTDRIKRRIPDAPREADFLAQLADAAEKSEVELVDYRPTPAVEKEKHHQMTISVSAVGSYAAICRFLDRIETLPRLCHITGLEIEAGDLTATTYPFDLKLQVFYSRTAADVTRSEEDGNG